MPVIQWLDRYAFLIILLYCLEVLAPELSPKAAMMDADAGDRTASISGGNLVKQVFWVAALFFLAWRFIQLNFLTVQAQRQLFLLLALSGLALVSVLWSGYTSYTVKRAVFQAIFCFCVFSSFFLARYYQTYAQSLYIATGIVVVMILLSVVFGGAFMPDGSLAGFTKGKNLLGQYLLAMIVMLALVIKLDKVEVKKLYIALALVFGFLILTGSKTSTALVILFAALAFSGTLMAKFVVSFAFITFAAVFIFIPGLSYIFADMVHIGQYLSPNAITGRGIIWDTLYYDLFYFSKVTLGYGYGAYFGVGVIPYFFDDPWSFLQHIASSHNGYLDMFLQFGLLGSVFVVGLFIALSMGIRAKWLAASLIVPVVYSFTESAVFRDQSMMWFLTVVLFAYIADYRELETDTVSDTDDADLIDFDGEFGQPISTVEQRK